MTKPTDCIETLRRFNCWRRGSDAEVMIQPAEIGKAIDQAIAEVERLRKIESVVKSIANSNNTEEKSYLVIKLLSICPREKNEKEG